MLLQMGAAHFKYSKCFKDIFRNPYLKSLPDKRGHSKEH